jgi:hypothetical protein
MPASAVLDNPHRTSSGATTFAIGPAADRGRTTIAVAPWTNRRPGDDDRRGRWTIATAALVLMGLVALAARGSGEDPVSPPVESVSTAPSSAPPSAAPTAPVAVAPTPVDAPDVSKPNRGRDNRNGDENRKDKKPKD